MSKPTEIGTLAIYQPDRARQRLADELELARGVVSNAAKSLKISRRTWYALEKKLGLDLQSSRGGGSGDSAHRAGA